MAGGGRGRVPPSWGAGLWVWWSSWNEKIFLQGWNGRHKRGDSNGICGGDRCAVYRQETRQRRQATRQRRDQDATRQACAAVFG